jgi:ABC-2 type transport system permease protein
MAEGHGQAYKLWVIAKREYLERVRSKWFVIATLAVPALVGVAFFLPAYLASRARASASVSNIAILDATGSDLGERIARLLVNDPSRISAADAEAAPAALEPTIRAVDPGALARAESLATGEVMRGEITGYLVLDALTMDGRLARYAGRNATSLPDLERVRSAVRQSVMTLRLERAGVDPATIRSMSTSTLQMSSERITEKGRGGSGGTGVLLGLGVAFVLYISIVLHGQAVLRGVLEEKTTRVAEVVLSSVKPSTLLGGKVLGVGAVGLTQQVLWIAISGYMIQKLAPLITRGSATEAASASGMGFLSLLTGVGPAMLAWVLAFFLIGFTFYAALYAAIGSMVNSEQEAQQAAGPVIFLLVGTFLFAQPVMFNPTGTMAKILSWLPFSAPIIMPLRMSVTELGWVEKLSVLVVGTLACVLVIWLAARIYRVGMLMYGKRPTLRELVRWIRYA